MDPSLEPHLPGQPAHNPATLALSFLSLDPEKAHLTAQQMLFPASPRAVCAEIGLNWWAALKLHADGWLSFAPDRTTHLDEGQEAELRFLGALVAAGCDHGMLTILLGNLAKPYSYDLRRVYFEWCSRKWRLLPDPRANPEAAFTDWLDLLVARGDTGTLSGILELAQDALARVRNAGGEPFLMLHPRKP